MSHLYAMDVPTYLKPLFMTDAAVNIAPTLEHKREICQNAVDLIHLLGNERPSVAVLAAVETVNRKMSATIDGASLTAMAVRGQITGATVDGPLAFDNALSAAAAATKGIVSPVAGNADILKIPIVVTSRADRLRVRLASIALAKLVAERTAQKPGF